MKQKNNLQKYYLKVAGFTLIELLVVISIIGFLASGVLASLKSAREKAYDAQIMSDMTQVRNALELYAGANNYSYPPLVLIDSSTIAKKSDLNSLNKNVINPLISIFFKKVYAQGRNANCVYYDNLESVLVPTYIGEMPKHPTDDGAGACYKYFADDINGTIVATAYTSLVTEKFSNGTSKQVGVILGSADVNTLKILCSSNKLVANTPFPLFSAGGGGDVCDAETIVDIVIGVTKGEGDLSSDTYI